MRVYRSPGRLYNALIRCEVLDPCFMVRCPCSCPCCFFPMPSGLSLVECLPVGPALAIPQFISFPVSAHPARSTWCCSSCLTGSHHDLFFFGGGGIRPHDFGVSDVSAGSFFLVRPPASYSDRLCGRRC